MDLNQTPNLSNQNTERDTAPEITHHGFTLKTENKATNCHLALGAIL